ncbi:MAG: 50S ribosomal protein L35 [Myxococcota bacterium]
MPKLKTRRSVAKRFKVSASGKIRRRRAFRNHILTKKSAKRKRQLRKDTNVDPVDSPRIRQQIPYL